MTATAVSRYFAADGPLAGALPGYAPRSAQVELAETIAPALTEGSVLVAEAGTGIGKTWAYLVPVLDWGQRTIVSTGTKTLQDQLYFRDLPAVAGALGKRPRTALLKGRGNYLCLHRMQRAADEGRLPGREAVAELAAIREWAGRTVDGDLTLSETLRGDSPLWPMVTSTADNCLGTQCPAYDDCWVVRARRQAQEADIVVVNHHLLFADMAVRQRGFGEVLPGADAFILDEAHQVPETATRFFSTSLSTRQLEDFCRDVLAEAGGEAGVLGAVIDPVNACQDAVRDLLAAAAESLPERTSWPRFLATAETRAGLQRLDEAIAGLEPALDAVADASRGLESCQRRRAELAAILDALDTVGEGDTVRWFERRGRGMALHLTPLNVAETFAAHRAEFEAAWIMTSATLAVQSDFGHFIRALGLEDAATVQLASPFDYRRNARLWLPEGLPEPRDPGFVAAVLAAVRPVLEASDGRAFLLFTSHRALREAAALLADDCPWPLFVQGDAPRSLLLERFRAAGNGVLLGAASFWEGVDVMGEALSLVVIDKLPFAAPDDPVAEARAAELRRRGGNPFMELVLPQAVIALKQGAGRLIRDPGDRGALVICDPRLRTRGYGQAFLDSLPPMATVADRSELIAFFAETAAYSTATAAAADEDHG